MPQYRLKNTAGASGIVVAPKGDKGDRGDTGAQGIQGIPGIKGDKGDRGDAGAQGAQGIPGTSGTSGTGEVALNPATLATLPAASTSNRGAVRLVSGSGLPVGINAIAGVLVYSDGFDWRYAATGAVLGTAFNLNTAVKLRETAENYTTTLDGGRRIVAIEYTYLDGSKILDRYRYDLPTDTEPSEALLDTTSTALFSGTSTVLATGYTVSIPSLVQGEAVVVSINTNQGLFSAGTITPSVAGITGTFNPVSVTLDASSSVASFSFTPTSAGNAIFSFTNTAGLTNPANQTINVPFSFSWSSLIGGATAAGTTLTLPNAVGGGAEGTLAAGWQEVRFVLSAADGNDRTRFILDLSGVSGNISGTSFGNAYDGTVATLRAAVSLPNTTIVSGVAPDGRAVKLFEGNIPQFVSLLRTTPTEVKVRTSTDGSIWTDLVTVPNAVASGASYLKIYRNTTSNPYTGADSGRAINFTPLVS